MVKRMLIDATHPEETRVVVLDGNRLEEFDFESSTKEQLKGNIYLAKVTRVEPSLQAAFVEYGGNRHGFLAFNEIHPDYYRIPIADRERLIAELTPEPEPEPDTHDDADANGTDVHEAGAESDARADHGGSDEDAAEDEGADEAHAAADDQHDHHGHNHSEHDHDHAHDHDHDHDHDVHAHADDEQDDANDRTGGSTMAEATGLTRDADDVRHGEILEPVPVAALAEESAVDHGDEATRHDGSEDGQDGAEHGAAETGADGERTEDSAHHDEESVEPPPQVETLGGDEINEPPPRRHRSSRSYKIQEVIARRQIMLVQVVKEERGTKGAALTTFLSLAGRYCVLMPNTPRGGGVSRKITSAADRKRLKTMLDDFNLPEGMAVIVRTAGMERPKPEIKRDYEYLLRLWDEIRELTLKSSAPAVIHEEGDLVKRAIRDLYQRDVAEILVEGEEGYRTAKSFMKMIVPSHAKRVQPYRDPAIPLFQRFQVESQLDAIHSTTVQLRSGGYIVINPTEALVSIDVNSGRATRERHIEETALKTNLEAADEVARQVRLRDLAGLIVIDFIDMEENRNNHAVERRIKEAMKNDRARIQIGKISAFGLLELSRQRLRPSLIEASGQRCPHCNGTGTVRSTESTALHVLRAIEEEGIRGKSAEIRVDVPTIVALYILNQKREALIEAESRYHLKVQIGNDDSLIPPDYKIDRLRQRLPGEEGAPVALPLPKVGAIVDEDDDVADDSDVEIEGESEEETAVSDEQSGDGADRGRGRGRRRGRRRRRNGEDGGDQAEQSAQPDGESDPDEGQPALAEGEDGEEHQAANGNGEGDGRDGDGSRRRRRRGKRGGRRHGRTNGDGQSSEFAADAELAGEAPLNQESPLIDSLVDGDDDRGEPEAAPRAPSRVAGEAVAAAAAAFARSSEDSDRQSYHRRWAGRTEPQSSVAGEAPSDVAVAQAAPAEPEAPAPVEAQPVAAPVEPQTVVAPVAEERQSELLLPAASDDKPAPQVAPVAEPVPVAEEAVPNPAIQVTVVADTSDASDKPRRGGWWGRLSGRS